MPTGGRLASWLFTKRGESVRAHDLNPGPEDYKSSALNDTPSPLNTNNDLSPNSDKFVPGNVYKRPTFAIEQTISELKETTKIVNVLRQKKIIERKKNSEVGEVWDELRKTKFRYKMYVFALSYICTSKLKETVKKISLAAKILKEA